MQNKRAIAIALIVLLIISAGVYSVLSSSSDEPTMPAAVQQQPATDTPQAAMAMPAASVGTYTDYSEQAVANAQGSRVLFFHAPWCPQCRELEASIKSGTIPSNVTIFKVDYDTNQKLRQQYGVTIQTSVVLLDAQGKAAKKYVPYDEPSLESVVTNLL